MAGVDEEDFELQSPDMIAGFADDEGEDGEEIVQKIEVGKLRFSVSFVTQGRHRFYTLTVPSEVLANHWC